MKDKKYIILFTIIVLAFTIYLFIKGFTVQENIGTMGCNAKYERYVIKSIGERLDPDHSLGRWKSTRENLDWAVIDVGFCLCEKYNEKPSPEMENTIKEWCKKLSHCEEALISNTTDFCKGQLWPFMLGVEL